MAVCCCSGKSFGKWLEELHGNSTIFAFLHQQEGMECSVLSLVGGDSDWFIAAFPAFQEGGSQDRDVWILQQDKSQVLRGIRGIMQGEEELILQLTQGNDAFWGSAAAALQERVGDRPVVISQVIEGKDGMRIGVHSGVNPGKIARRL